MQLLRPGLTWLVLAGAIGAQVPTDATVLRERRADKLASAFLRHAEWHTDLITAQRAAARTGKLIFGHCTRSFVPCGTSIRCEREVLSTPEFAAFAADVVLYCHITGHVDEATDRFLYTAGGSGWPHHVVLDATGRVLAHASERSVAGFEALVAKARAYLEAEREADAAIAAAQRRRFDAGLRAGALGLAEARVLFAQLRDLDPPTIERYVAQLTDLEIATIAARFDRFDPADHAPAGAELYALWRVGKRPSSRAAVRDFWAGILAHLENQPQPDLELYAQGFAALEAEFGDDRGYQRYLTERRDKLTALRAGKSG